MKLEPSDRIVRAWALFLAVLHRRDTRATAIVKRIAKDFVKFINGGEE